MNTNAIAKNAAMLVGAFIGALVAEKIFLAREARKDNGNFAKAEAELAPKAPEVPEVTTEFHRDPPQDSRVAYEVAREPDAGM